jgi:hypothetical protein
MQQNHRECSEQRGVSDRCRAGNDNAASASGQMSHEAQDLMRTQSRYGVAQHAGMQSSQQESHLEKHGFPQLNISDRNSPQAQGSGNRREEAPGDRGDKNTSKPHDHMGKSERVVHDALMEKNKQPQMKNQEKDNSHSSGLHGADGPENNSGNKYSSKWVPPQARDPLIKQALQLAGHQGTPQEIKDARTLVGNESNFKAGIVNNWDVNARKGDPSVGWAQTTGATFSKYHAQGHNDIRNPVDNLAAGIRYADSKYGKRDPNHNGLHWVAVNRSARGLGY